MIDEGKPDIVVAFPGGRGTADMVRRARKAALALLNYLPAAGVGCVLRRKCTSDDIPVIDDRDCRDSNAQQGCCLGGGWEAVDPTL